MDGSRSQTKIAFLSGPTGYFNVMFLGLDTSLSTILLSKREFMFTKYDARPIESRAEVVALSSRHL